MESTNTLNPPPKKFEVKRIRSAPYRPYVLRKKENGQENRWTTFKKLLMNIPNY